MKYRGFEITEIKQEEEDRYFITLENNDPRAYKAGLIIVTDKLENLNNIIIEEVDAFMDFED